MRRFFRSAAVSDDTTGGSFAIRCTDFDDAPVSSATFSTVCPARRSTWTSARFIMSSIPSSPGAATCAPGVCSLGFGLVAYAREVRISGTGGVRIPGTNSMSDSASAVSLAKII